MGVLGLLAPELHLRPEPLGRFIGPYATPSNSLPLSVALNLDPELDPAASAAGLSGAARLSVLSGSRSTRDHSSRRQRLLPASPQTPAFADGVSIVTPRTIALRHLRP